VVGGKEAEERTVAPRTRDGRQVPAMPLAEFMGALGAAVREKRKEFGL
jgi:threonyl-tRNA synthetase